MTPCVREGVELHDPHELFQHQLSVDHRIGHDIMFQNIDNMHKEKVDRGDKD